MNDESMKEHIGKKIRLTFIEEAIVTVEGVLKEVTSYPDDMEEVKIGNFHTEYRPYAANEYFEVI